MNWNLSNNEIDDDGAIALLDHMPSFSPSLSVDFSGNHIISSDIMRRTREKRSLIEFFEVYN